MYPTPTSSQNVSVASPTATELQDLSAKMTKLMNEKKSAREYQKRKHEDWNENYELYRNKVKTNRLTQRQAVNIPLMKETIKTLGSDMDDAPSTEWSELSGDEMKQIIYQQIWDDNFDNEAMDLKDFVDKKNVLMYGLSTKFLNLTKKGVSCDILDVYDVVYDPLMNPLDVESARFIVRQNIFRSLREILVDDRYEQSGKDKLKNWLASDKGMIQSGKNKEEWDKKMERLKAMGVNSEEFPVYAGGDVIVQLTEHYTLLWDKTKKKFERHVVCYADDTIELCDDLLVDCIGIEEWPFEPWYEDLENTDIYPDSVADTIRTPNKVINVWYSQMIENRTLQNFQMHWYDATIEGYTPQTYEPSAGKMLAAPGKPNESIMPVVINGLDETMNAMNFLISIAERASGATAIEKGTPEEGVQTLGEVQILIGKATERAKTIGKFYRRSWYRFAVKWDKMMQANSFPEMKLYKTGINGKVYEKTVYNADWKSKAGYRPSVASSSEQEADQIKSIQKFSAVIQQFPNNTVMKRILQARELKTLDLTAQELKEIQDEEDRLAEEAEKARVMAAPTPENPQGMPQEDPNALSASIADSLNQLSELQAQ